ncbi:hypothetical protein LEP1GSC171_2728 [Leptospira santarosai str. HAI1380]|nr:hypothetical protein LEP1GSC171_2728 [Leptospira santarosai str. HAI1380]
MAILYGNLIFTRIIFGFYKNALGEEIRLRMRLKILKEMVLSFDSFATIVRVPTDSVSLIIYSLSQNLPSDP